MLESRTMMSVSKIETSSRTLTIRADDFGASVEIRRVGASIVAKDLTAARSWSFTSSAIDKVVFEGGAGDDSFVNKAMYLPSVAYGRGGNDYLRGSNVTDWLLGGTGNDVIYGRGGEDFLWGDAGDDEMFGNAGDDQLVGGDGDDLLEGQIGDDSIWGDDGDDVLIGRGGDDRLIGGNGNDHLNGCAGWDRMWGGAGDDVFVAIDAGVSDWMAGHEGKDTFWVDKAGWTKDAIADAGLDDKVQEVAFFSNGADKTLNRDSIIGPDSTVNNKNYAYNRNAFYGNPLFSEYGPSMLDVTQGALGDCYFLAALEAIVQASPAAITQNIVDFNDGTFGVRFGTSYYRVDSSLPVVAGTSRPVFAALGRENSMWVAIAEKAYAHYRKGLNSYSSIEGGWSGEVNKAFGADARYHVFQGYPNATVMGDEIARRHRAGEAVTIGFVSDGAKKAVNSGDPIVLNHAYAVIGVQRDASSKVTGIVVRNPWGVDGGGSKDSNPNDGILVLTPSQIYRYSGQVCWGRVPTGGSGFIAK